MGVEAAEHVAGEKGKLNLLVAIGPAAAAAVDRKKLVKAPILGHGSYHFFAPGLDAQGEPALGRAVERFDVHEFAFAVPG